MMTSIVQLAKPSQKSVMPVIEHNCLADTEHTVIVTF